jgi:flagellar basal-body rod protein FlgG
MRQSLGIAAALIPVAAILCGCAGSHEPDAAAAFDWQMTRALERATEPSLTPAEIRTQSMATVIAAAGAMETRAAVCRENLANAETDGYKAGRVLQTDTLDTSTSLDLGQGSMGATDRQLDVAINGTGFFRVRVADSIGDGTAYTRRGNFFMNADGALVLGTRDGPSLMPAMTVPIDTTGISVSDDGTVSVTTSGSVQPMNVGRIELATFVSAEQLKPIGSGLFIETTDSGAARCGSAGEDGLGTVLQGYLERSNVDSVRELAQLKRIERQLDLLRHLLTK